MTRRLEPTFLVFGAMGGLLLLTLVLPIINLFIHAEGADWMRSLREQGASDALRVSALSSTMTVAITTLFGVPLGYLLARGRLPFTQIWIGLVFLPMVVPDLAGGILLLQTFGPHGTIGHPLGTWQLELTNNLAGIVLAQLFVSAPFVVVSAVAAFAGIDPKLEMAAAILGDSQWHIFWRISLPLAWPGIAAGITLAWIRALGEFGATLIVAYNPHSLPVNMWVQFESNGLTGALPVAFLLVLLAGAAVAISALLGRLSGYRDIAAVLGDSPGALT